MPETNLYIPLVYLKVEGALFLCFWMGSFEILAKTLVHTSLELEMIFDSAGLFSANLGYLIIQAIMCSTCILDNPEGLELYDH